MGLKASDDKPRRRPEDTAANRALIAQKLEELKSRIFDGGPREATIRALIYIRMPDGVVDERGFNLLRRMREETGKGVTLATFKRIVREQFLMLSLDERRTVNAIPSMLASNPDLASRMKGKLDRTSELVGVQSELARERLAEIEAIFESDELQNLTRQHPAAAPTAQAVRNSQHH